MDYTVKLQTDGDTGPPFICMSQSNRGPALDSATESKFYLPVGVSPSSGSSPLKRIWSTLFDPRS